MTFSLLGTTQVLPAPLLTHFRDPVVPLKLQPAGLVLPVSADAKEKPVGNEKMSLEGGLQKDGFPKSTVPFRAIYRVK